MLSPSPHTPLDQRRLLALSRRLYPRSLGGGMLRLLQRHRLRICPFEPILDAVPRGARVLDVGCGGGLLLGLLAATGRLAPEGSAGFDASARAIRLAKAMAAHLPRVVDRAPAPGLAFVHLGVHDPWPAGPFDAVCIVDVLHHVPPSQQEGVIAQAASRLCPGGVLVYKDMADRPRWRAWANRLHDLVLARQWIAYVPVARVERWAAGLGLAQILAGDRTCLWYAHQWRVFRKA
jgi:2-polyprenyl-3-methyl-5-hydroxy-6-metoxy-1,4-benzoquinol methylase